MFSQYTIGKQKTSIGDKPLFGTKIFRRHPIKYPLCVCVFTNKKNIKFLHLHCHFYFMANNFKFMPNKYSPRINQVLLFTARRDRNTYILCTHTASSHNKNVSDFTCMRSSSLERVRVVYSHIWCAHVSILQFMNVFSFPSRDWGYQVYSTCLVARIYAF